MASVARVSISGGAPLQASEKITSSRCLCKQRSSIHLFPKKSRRTSSVCARYSDDGRRSSSDFAAGFILGGAICGTLAYILAPQMTETPKDSSKEVDKEVKKAVQNANEHGFSKAKPPAYFDDGGLENSRNTLYEKISQLNNAIDKVSTRLRGGSGATKTVEVDELDGVC